jgi:hypothetical protein
MKLVPSRSFYDYLCFPEPDLLAEETPGASYDSNGIRSFFVRRQSVVIYCGGLYHATRGPSMLYMVQRRFDPARSTAFPVPHESLEDAHQLQCHGWLKMCQ